MIKADKGSVEMKGRGDILFAELCTILVSVRENFGEQIVDLAVEKTKVSDSEIHAETEESKETEKIVKDFLGLIFNKGEK